MKKLCFTINFYVDYRTFQKKMKKIQGIGKNLLENFKVFFVKAVKPSKLAEFF